MRSSFDLLFSPFKEIQFVDIQFDFKLDPDHFMEWLKKEDDDIIGDYARGVAKNCEFACLYIAMLLHAKELHRVPVIYSGNFGFWEHYWIGYTYENKEYFIDLTLQQFIPSAPKIAISLASNDEHGYKWYEDIPRETITEYVERQEAFRFYTDPVTLFKPHTKKII